MFKYLTRSHFYQTDAMGIIHHANYVLYFEEARVAWVRQQAFYSGGEWFDKINFPVLSCEVQYKKPVYFDDELEITVEVSKKGATLIFNYTLVTNRFPNPAAFGKTTHAIMDMEKRLPIRIPAEILAALKP